VRKSGRGTRGPRRLVWEIKRVQEIIDNKLDKRRGGWNLAIQRGERTFLPEWVSAKADIDRGTHRGSDGLGVKAALDQASDGIRVASTP
jgi:hypothetical protein